MNKKNIFELKQVYLLESTKTNHPYLTEKGECLLFLHESDAKTKSEAIPDTRISPPRFYSLKVLSTMCYSVGASSMLLTVGDREEPFRLREIDLKIGLYNHRLAATATQLKQNGLIKNLYELALCEYIVPAKIIQDGDEVRIEYGVVRHSVDMDKMMYIAFSNLDEFAVWNAEVTGWHPLMVTYRKLRRICGKEGFFLNPGGSRLIITPDLLKKIDEHILKNERQKKETAATGNGKKEGKSE